jgi:hypothetical protein
MVFALILGANSLPSDLSGRWTLTMDPDFRGNPNVVDVTIKQDGQRLVVRTADGKGAPMTGDVTGRKVTWRSPSLPGDTSSFVTFTGEVDRLGTTIKGTWDMPLTGEVRHGRFRLKKRK